MHKHDITSNTETNYTANITAMCAWTGSKVEAWLLNWLFLNTPIYPMTKCHRLAIYCKLEHCQFAIKIILKTFVFFFSSLLKRNEQCLPVA